MNRFLAALPGRRCAPFVGAIALACSCSATVAHAAPQAWSQLLSARDPARITAFGEGDRLPGFARDPAGSVRAWLALQRPDAVRPGIDTLIVTEQRHWQGAELFRIEQWSAGLPVLDAEARVLVAADGRILGVVGRLYDRLAPSAAGREAAPARAWAGADWARGAHLEAVQRALARTSAGDRVVDLVSLRDAAGVPRRIVADAADGRRWRDEESAAHAVGRVYGRDGADSLRDVPLERLGGDGSQLIGRAMRVERLGAPVLSRPDGDFRFTPSDPDTTPFDQVQAYDAADHYLHEMIAPLGPLGNNDTIVVRVHVPLYPSVATTTGRFVQMGEPIPGFSRDPVKGRDIMTHEVQHAVTFSFGVHNTGPNREAAALHEALSDYFAASYTNDAAIGEWVYPLFPNGVTRVRTDPAVFCYANYDHVSFGGVATGSPWANGMILSSALWDLRDRIGRSADSLVFESLALLPSEPVWGQFATALLLADRTVHGGRFADAIVQVCSARGIIGQVDVLVNGPRRLSPGAAGDYHLSATGLVGQAVWSVVRYHDAAPEETPVVIATGDSVRVREDDDFELRIASASAWGDSVRVAFRVDVRPPQAAILGPTTVVRADTITFRATVQGAGALSRIWWLFPTGGVNRVLGFADSVRVASASPYQLKLEVSDVLGRTVSAFLNVRPIDARLEGPVSLAPGASGEYALFVNGLNVTTATSWETRPWCDGAPCGAWQPLTARSAAMWRPEHDGEVRASYDVPGAGTLRESLFVNVDLPAVLIAGPFAPADGGTGSEYHAVVRGLPTQQLRWFRRAQPGGAEALAGEGRTFVLRDGEACALRLESTDKLGRVANVGAEIDADGTLRIPGLATAVSLRLATSASGEQTLVYAFPAGDRARVVLYDIAGREIARLADGTANAGSHAVRVPKGLAPGVYLARFTWRERALSQRVLIVP